MTAAAYLFLTVAVVCISGIVALRMWIDYKPDMAEPSEANYSTYSSTETRES
jgi:hypothetical protein